MRIVIHITPGNINICPDPARVTVGTDIEWKIDVVALAHPNESMIGEIYFRQGSPFPPGNTDGKGYADANGNADVVVKAPGPAGTPGDYKYGVRVEDRKGTIVDVDPRLIVT